MIEGMPGSKRARVVRQPIRARDLFLLSAWCGLAAGLLEVGTRVLCRAIDPSQRLYLMSHHFIWLGPLSNLAFFLGIGLVLAVAIKLAPRATGWFGPRLICACTILPVLIAAGPRIYTSAWLLVSLGVAVCLVPIFERHRIGVTKLAPLELSVHDRVWSSCSPVSSSSGIGSSWRESQAVPLPPADSPNILFIVLDTVRADRLSLYGYERPTTPESRATLEARNSLR